LHGFQETNSGITRREFSRKAGLATLSLTLGGCASDQQMQGAKPNFIFILIDDMGWKDVGFMGSRYYRTPNIDRLSREGMVFTDAYAAAPNCAPSRACLLTGLYTPRHGIYTVNSSERGRARNRRLIPVPNTTELAPEFVTIVEALWPEGYASASIGKWHLGNDPEMWEAEQPGIHRLISVPGESAPFRMVARENTSPTGSPMKRSPSSNRTAGSLSSST